MIKPNRSQGLSARGRKLLRLFGKIGAVLGVQLLLIVLGLYGVMYVLACGPSESARKLFVMSVKETSAVGFLANLYLPQQEIDRIMAETDCPYMTPEPFRGEINEPKNVIYVYRKLSEILDFDIEELSEIIRSNVKRLFYKLKVDS